jgi:hypothetical protein
MPTKKKPKAPEVEATPQVKATLGTDPAVVLGPQIVKKFDDFDRSMDIDLNGEVDNEFLVAQIENKLHLALQYMGPDKMQDANLNTLVKFFGILLDRRQLLKGEPTQIVTNTDRRALNDLLPAILAEAERRGMTVPLIEGDMEVVSNG